MELARAECALLDGEIAAARRLAATARDRFRRRANDRWRRDAELVLLHADLAAGRPGGRLAGPALRLAAEFRAAGLDTPARTSQLIAAEALLRAGRADQAREVAGEAGPVRPADPVSARLHTRLVRARLSIAAADTGTARREARTGLAELARHQAQFGSIDLQTASAVHGRQLAELDLSMALADGRPAGVLAAIERGRATSSRLPRISAPSDPVVAELLAELRRTVEALRSIQSDATAAEQAGAQRRRVADLQRATAGPGLAGGRDGQCAAAGVAGPDRGRAEPDRHGAGLLLRRRRPAACRGARRRPDPDRPLGSSAAVSERVRRVRADLDVLAGRRLPTALLASICATLNRSLASLAGELLDPLRLPEDRLVIVPTGALAALPWTSLPPMRGRPVVVAPSATAWLAASRAGSRPWRRAGGGGGRSGPGARLGRVARRRLGVARRAGADRRAGRPGRAGVGAVGRHRGARRRARPAPCREPAVLPDPAGGRAAVRLRTRPHQPGRRARGAVGLRARPGHHPGRRRGAGPDQRAAAAGQPVGDLRGGPGAGRRGRRGDDPLPRGAGRRPGLGRRAGRGLRRLRHAGAVRLLRRPPGDDAVAGRRGFGRPSVSP